jgi:hypothetical protein
MRNASILSIALHNPRDETDPEVRASQNLDNMLALLDEADDFDPDFVCFPEACLHHAARNDGLLEEIAEPIPGPATEAVAEKARALDSYVVLPMYEREGETYYNSAALITPDGDVQGVFRKVAPTIGEIESGLTPGSEVPVWETEFGTVGALICWDAQYTEVGRAFARQGVDLVLFPTHGSADAQFRNWSRRFGYHVVLCDKNKTRVYRPTGDVVAHNGGWDNPRVEEIDLGGGEAHFSLAEVNLDCGTYHRSGGFEWARALQRKYADSVQISAYNNDGVFVIESIDEDVTLADLEAEFDGMMPRWEYEDAVRERARAAADDSPLEARR